MKNLRYKFATLAVGIITGWAAYYFSAPWWAYISAIGIFLGGLMSFSIDSTPDRSGYEKRADDSRTSFGSDGGTGDGGA